MTETQSSLGAGRARVALTAIEPWDFVTENGSGPFTGTIVQAHTKEVSSHGYDLLVRLDKPVRAQAAEWSYFVVTPTHRGARLSSIEKGLRAVCALTSLTDEQANSATPFAAIDYARGVKVLADLLVL